MAGSFSPYVQSQVFMPHLTASGSAPAGAMVPCSLWPLGRQPGLCGQRLLARTEWARARVLQTRPAKSPSLSGVHLAEPGRDIPGKTATGTFHGLWADSEVAGFRGEEALNPSTAQAQTRLTGR